MDSLWGEVPPLDLIGTSVVPKRITTRTKTVQVWTIAGTSPVKKFRKRSAAVEAARHVVWAMLVAAS